MSTFLFNDFIGAVVTFVKDILGWLTLWAIVATGFWVSSLYVARRAMEVLVLAKRDFRRVLDRPKKPLQGVVPQLARSERGFASVKP